MRSTRSLWLAPLLVGLVAACENGPIGPGPELDAAFAIGDIVTSAPTMERLVVCKTGPAGTYEFDVTYTGTPAPASLTSFTLNAGECKHVATSGSPVTATIVEDETALPANVQFASASVAYAGDNVTAENITGATVEVTFGEDPSGAGVTPGPSGATVTYVNELIPGDEGCTPGYWKNHTDSWAATGYTTGQTLESVFDVPDSFGLDNVTLIDALSFGGGPGALGGAKILLRAAVAAVLNAAHPGVDYPETVTDIITDVNAALASGNRATMLSLAASLDADNNLGCPLN